MIVETKEENSTKNLLLGAAMTLKYLAQLQLPANLDCNILIFKATTQY